MKFKIAAALLACFVIAWAWIGTPSAQAHEAAEEGGGLIPAVSVCNPAEYGGITWRLIRCIHENHLHTQYRNGAGTPGHTVVYFRHEAHRVRVFLEGLHS